MLFPSSGGLLDASSEPLTDDSLVAVWAESTAVINDRDGNGDAVDYPNDVDIPLVGVDESGSGTVAAIGSVLVDDGNLVPELEGDDPLGDLGNEEFLLNLYDEYADGESILWDESHGQFYDLESFQNFEAYAEDNGYTVDSTDDITADLSGASVLVVTSPSDSFSDAELSALSDFLDNGGLVVMHNQSDFNDFDETGNFNDILSALDAGFRFNDAEVGDEQSNVGIYYQLVTSNFNDTDFSLFGDRAGITIDLRAGVEYDVSVDGVADGDTMDVVFDGDEIGLETDYTGTVRVLGIDTPESAGIAQTAERPEEWEGLAYDAGAPDAIDELVFDSVGSLLDANGEVLTDDTIAVVSAESSATNTDSDGNGDAVSYPDDVDIPLVAIDGSIVGLGAPFVADGFDSQFDNEEFLLNVYDQVIDGDTVLWDEGHDQFYNLASFPEFESYAEEEGYDLQATTNLTNDLSGADAVVITSPSAFSDAELSALSNFVEDGGAVILHDQADFNDFDKTSPINDIASALGAGFRFNDDQVIDDQNNTGQNFVPTTTNFDSSSSLFDKRSGLDDDPDARTTDYLTNWASNASDFAGQLDGKDVTLFFDENESLRDPTRLLAYIRYDASGNGQRDTLYNKQVIEEGYARAYGSSLSRHEEFWDAEWTARQNNRGVWTDSDLANASSYRDGTPEEAFAPQPSSIKSVGSMSRNEYATLYASETATQSDTVDRYVDWIPLLGRDTNARTAVGGSLFIDESYERLEGFDADTAEYDNFAVVTTVLESLAETEGPVYIDGGHGQFGTDYALSSEDAAYYQRHLEGRQINLEQINDLTADRLSNARALIITPPDSGFSQAELVSLQTFRDNGGAVILLGSRDAPEEAIARLNEIAESLESELRLNTDTITDDTNNLVDDADIVTTNRISLIEKYAADDGRIDTNGVFDAVEDWQNHYIRTDLLQDTIDAWQDDEPVA
jgi:endonuclease YncB( thermonuclease family)